jgi:hypothetical protein
VVQLTSLNVAKLARESDDLRRQLNSVFPYDAAQLGLQVISASVQNLKVVNGSGVVQAGARNVQIAGGNYPFFYLGASTALLTVRQSAMAP